MARRGSWVRVRPFTPVDKATVTAACDGFLANRLKPRFLPEVRETQFNYPIDIVGRWRGSKFSFLVRYRSGFPDNAGEEFDSPFARLDYLDASVVEMRFDVFWRRHTRQWWRFVHSIALQEALRLIETEPLLQPHT